MVRESLSASIRHNRNPVNENQKISPQVGKESVRQWNFLHTDCRARSGGRLCWRCGIGNNGKTGRQVEILNANACADQFAPNLCLILETVEEMPAVASIPDLVAMVGPWKPGQHHRQAPAGSSEAGCRWAFGKKTQNDPAIRREHSA